MASLKSRGSGVSGKLNVSSKIKVQKVGTHSVNIGLKKKCLNRKEYLFKKNMSEKNEAILNVGSVDG